MFCSCLFSRPEMNVVTVMLFMGLFWMATVCLWAKRIDWERETNVESFLNKYCSAVVAHNAGFYEMWSLVEDSQKVHWNEKFTAACVVILTHAHLSLSVTDCAKDLSPTSSPLCSPALVVRITHSPGQHCYCAARGVCSFDDVSFI